MSDFIIIGGGVAGLSAASALSSDGSVTLFEAEAAFGYHASGRSAAMFLADYGNETVRSLNYASQKKLQDAGVLSPRKMMLVGKPTQREAFEQERVDFGMREIALSEAMALLPILNTETTAFAAMREDVFDLDTDRVMQHFRRNAVKQGAILRNDAPVTSLKYVAGQWEITAGVHSERSPVIVNAAGAWADEVAIRAGLTPIGLQPYRRSMARLPAPAGHDVSKWPFTDGVGEAWYAKPDAGSWLVSPSEEHAVPAQDAWADDMVLAEGLARYEEMVTEPVTHMQANWAGLRTFAPDRALVIGPAPTAPGFFWCAGQGGYGFQTAFAAADLLCDLVLRRTPDLGLAAAQALSPARFAP